MSDYLHIVAENGELHRWVRNTNERIQRYGWSNCFTHAPGSLLGDQHRRVKEALCRYIQPTLDKLDLHFTPLVGKVALDLESDGKFSCGVVFYDLLDTPLFAVMFHNSQLPHTSAVDAVGLGVRLADPDDGSTTAAKFLENSVHKLTNMMSTFSDPCKVYSFNYVRGNTKTSFNKVVFDFVDSTLNQYSMSLITGRQFKIYQSSVKVAGLFGSSGNTLF
jgi:hypothetical protein